jgi:dihydrofolate reductase/transposase
MSRVELFERIRREHRDQGVTIRALAERYRVHRRTVRQALASAVPPARKPPEREAPALGAHEATIRGWLEADQAAPRKQRHTARRVWQRLRDEHGAQVAESTVRAFVAAVKAELAGAAPNLDDFGGTAVRKIILMMSVSLDGFIEGPDRELDWHMVDDELHGHFNEQLSAMGAFLSGRVTYELMAGFWPTADTDPSSTGPMVEFARIWRDMPKIVFSRTLERAGWNTTVVRDVVADQVMELKAQPGGDLVLGGADIAAAFMRHDLIDEYRLYVHPVVIGQGKPLFQASDTRINLQLAETRTFGNGVVLLRYQRPR